MTTQPTDRQGESAVLDYTRLYAKLHKRSDNLNFLNKTNEDGRYYNPQTELNYVLTEPLEMDLMNISINRSINAISQSATVNIYFDETLDLFTKYDRIEVFVLDENGMEHQIFDGEFINKNTTSSLSEESISFELLDNLNLLNRINVPYTAKGTNVREYLLEAFLNAGLLPSSPDNVKGVALTGLNTYIPITTQLVNPNIKHFKATGRFMEFLSEIRKNYPFFVYGNRNAGLTVALPDFMYDNQLNVWDIDLQTSSAYVSVSNAFSLVNLIITIGYTDPNNRKLSYGIAFDGIGYAMNGGKINYRIEYAFDVFGYPELSRMATNILLKENKNFKVRITNLPFYHGFDVGDFVKISNHNSISSEQIFFIEDINHSLSIDSFSTEMTVSAYSLGVIPEDIVVTQQILDPLINVAIGETFREERT